MRASLSSAAFLLLSIGLFLSAGMVHADTPDQLHATILAALLSDPRTASVPPAQLQALVNVLADEAANQGLNPQDIKWQTAAVAASFDDTAKNLKGSNCVGIFPALCPFSDAFGFTGADVAVPLILFGTSGLLLFILYEVIKHHRKKLDAEKARATSEAASDAVKTPNQSQPSPTPGSGVAQ